jgi:F0F1-type ATP synthase beta subunit
MEEYKLCESLRIRGLECCNRAKQNKTQSIERNKSEDEMRCQEVPNYRLGLAEPINEAKAGHVVNYMARGLPKEQKMNRKSTKKKKTKRQDSK